MSVEKAPGVPDALWGDPAHPGAGGLQRHGGAGPPPLWGWPRRIAKTLSFKVGERPILVVAAGDARIDNGKYKHFFGVKAKMLTPEEAVERIGHAVGGVCPFALPEDVSVYLDESLRRFETVFPAVGSAASAIELTCPELERCCGERFCQWVDLCRGWQEA